MHSFAKFSSLKSPRTLVAAGACLAACLVSSPPLFADDAGGYFDGHYFSNRQDDDGGFDNRDHPNKIGAVFYIYLENHNFTQPASDISAPNQILGCPAAPYINSLITPGNPNAADVSYATAYHNVLATPSGNNPTIHPSEPNYIWQECGSNLGISNDNDPYGQGGSVAAIATFLAENPTFSGQNLSGLLQAAGIPWRAYQEDTNLLSSTGGNFNQGLGGTITNTPVTDPSQLTVPLVSFIGTATPPPPGATYQEYTNAYNGSHQYNFACKHDGTLFFVDTNGGDDPTPANVEAKYYRPLQELQYDLDHDSVARYNIITPDQYNEMHTALSNGFSYHDVSYPNTSDLSNVAQGDNFLSIVIPKIMASKAYKRNGMIVIWNDETEGTNQNDFSHTMVEIIISPLAKGNAYASSKNYTHSSDLNTLQKIFQVTGNTPTGFLNDAANPSPSPDGAYDLSDMFKPGVIPKTIPNVRIAVSPVMYNYQSHAATQTITVTNLLSVTIPGPIKVAFEDLTPGVSLVNTSGTSDEGPYVTVVPSNSSLAPGASASVTLQFKVPDFKGVAYNVQQIYLP
ncbi:MAG TPA: alkaline phosphatase family protein [Chthoniobacterales bacterium]|jgi:hypothetical protein|nr:alkaline phosphatase family protein [Chthoniobacterales bacterium]